MTLWKRGFRRSRDKLRTFYPYYQSGYDHQTLLDGNLPTTVLIAIILGKMVTYLELLMTKSYNILNAWFYKVTKTILSQLPGCLWPANLAGCWLNLMNSPTHNSFMKWSHEITWQTKTIISPIPQCPWPTKLTEWWLAIKSSHP